MNLYTPVVADEKAEFGLQCTKTDSSTAICRILELTSDGLRFLYGIVFDNRQSVAGIDVTLVSVVTVLSPSSRAVRLVKNPADVKTAIDLPN
jgi:hypothetical protein